MLRSWRTRMCAAWGLALLIGAGPEWSSAQQPENSPRAPISMLFAPGDQPTQTPVFEPPLAPPPMLDAGAAPASLPPPDTGSPTGAPEPDGSANSAEPRLSLEQIEAQRKEVEESAALDDETKQKLVELYKAAAAEVKQAQDFAARAATFVTDAQTIPSRLEKVKLKLADHKKQSPETFVDLSLAELEQLLAKQELQFTAQRTAMYAAENEPKRRVDKRKEIRAKLVELPNQFAKLRQQLEAIPPDAPTLVSQAQRTQFHARRLALQQEYAALEAELAKYDAEDAADLVRFQRDLATQEVAFAEQQLKALADQIKQKRAQAAQDAVRQARDEMIAVHPVLHSHAEANQQLAELSQQITKKIDAADREFKQDKEQFDRLRRQQRDTQDKVNAIGLTASVGALLRKQRAALIEQSPWRTGLPNRRVMIDETQFNVFEYDDQRAELASPDLVVESMLAGTIVEDSGERELLSAAAYELVERKREYLDSLIKNCNNYLDVLIKLDTTEREMATLVKDYQNYIDQRVLWIRSGNILATELQLDDSDRAALSPARWIEVGEALWSDLRRNVLIYVVVISLFLGLTIKRGRLRADLRYLGETAQKPGFFAFWPTLHAIFYTLVLASVTPAFLAFVAWRLISLSEHPFAMAVGEGLWWAAVLWFPLELLRGMCRGNGLGEAHFRWSSSSLRLLGKSLAWLIPVLLPLTFLTSMFYANDPTHGHDAIERTLFILQAIIVAAFLGRILHSRGVFRDYLAYNQGGWLDRLQFLWYWGAVSAPLVLAVLAFWGYYYTAQVLSWRLFATMCFMLGLLLVQATLMRWIMLARRKLSIAQARERAAAAAQAGDSAPSSLSNSILAEQAKEDLSAHSAQTQRLLATGMFTASVVGLWLIWVQVLPALSMLDQYGYEIESAETVAAATPLAAITASSSESPPAEQTGVAEAKKTTKITIPTMAFAMLILMLTLVSARDIPGLMEMAVLQRLPLEPSVRYAITSLTSYAIVMVGIVWAFSSLGLKWNQIQWLATALTFGLAFGLQEMFANFVAGIIILFERPIRVGDIVTVHDVSGVVSKIRIRATSITNWDRKEYVVPNKEFITGRLLNWTLSDTVNRVMVTVPVAQGTDIDQARQILLKIADDHPLLLKDPEPGAIFESFGEGTLNLVLRAFLPNLENRLAVINDLHTSVARAFHEAKIEIALPQRDLHIRPTVGIPAPQGLPEKQPEPTPSIDDPSPGSETEKSEREWSSAAMSLK